MAVRRHAARLATVCALLGGLVAFGATPAFADGDSVRVRSAGSFTAGGSAEGVSIVVRKRSDGCVLLRTALGLRLGGLRADQVDVRVGIGGTWFPVSVTGGQGSATTSATSPLNPRLCEGKSVTVRYRVAFEAGAPNGRVTISGAASSARGKALGRDAAAARVVGGRATASPTPKPSKEPSPTPVAVAAEVRAAGAAPGLVPVGGQGAAGNAAAEQESSGGSTIMFFGIGMVVVGILLIILLFRRSRADKEPKAADPAHVPLPRNPGGTTYRSGQGPAIPGPGPAFGQQPPTPGVYGSPSTPRPTGSPSTPRPTGSVYGSRPGAAPEAGRAVPDATAFPPVSSPPAPPVPGQHAPPGPDGPGGPPPAATTPR
ncbi:hypothetical protein [Micromonospora sp. KLBMP9576]|uniref:hypothetical protein n=1 Tax=Micromonospora sp. KLBMP9576 TaxID=3424769 RepID=UPI003D900DCD